jgi:hypothetical protein
MPNTRKRINSSNSHKSTSKTHIKTSNVVEENNSVFHHDKCCEATFDGIQHWYVSKFEKLGWMVLAKTHGHEDKIKEYKNSLKRLKEAIEHKLTHVTENDRKHDLMIMHHNVEILIDHADKDF